MAAAGCKQADLDSTERKNPAWHFTVVSSAFTLGSVFAPYTLSAGGWVWGSIFWIYSTLTTWWSGVLIGRCVLDGAKRGVGSTYPDMMADAFGKQGYWFTVVMQLITYYLAVSSLLVNAAKWCLLAWRVAQGPHEVGLCLWQWIFVVGAVVVVLAQIRTFRQVLPLAIVSLLSTFARQLILYYQIGSRNLLTECEPEYGGVTVRSVFNSLSTTAFLYGGHGMFPEEIREMRRPESYFRALHGTYVICAVVYASNAYVSYYVWGSWVDADIQFNWPLNTATLVSAVLSALWVLIEVTVSHVMLLSLMERTVVDPEQLAAQFSRTYKLPSWSVRLVLRVLFVCSEVMLAFMLASAGVADLQAFVGAFGFTALTYYSPFAAYWKLIARKHESWWWQLCYGAVFLSGVAIMFVGVYSAGSGIVENVSTYHLFDTSTCKTTNIVDLSSCKNPCRQAYGFNNSACAS